MSRGEILLPLICLVLLGTLMVFSSSFTRPQKGLSPAAAVLPVEGLGGGASRQNVPPEKANVVQQGVADPRIMRARKSFATPKVAVDAADLSPSSWENPFSPDLWQSVGWNFTSQSMRAPGTPPSSATFRRPYHKLMLECDILATEAPGSIWELQLATRNAQVLMSLILCDGRLTVVATENGLAHVVVEKALNPPLTNKAPRQFRVVATGNRIVVSWDGKRFLSTEQLAAQSGREIVWSIHSSGAAYEIPRMRVEGD